MSANALGRLCGACVFGLALLAGCTHQQHCPPGEACACQKECACAAYSTKPTPTPAHTVSAPATPKPAVAQAPRTPPAAAPKALAARDGPVQRTVLEVTPPPAGPGHAADYTWVSGQVEYSRLSNAWRLRYAAVDEADPFGGTITLTNDTLVSRLKDGETVRVRGRLVHPGAKAVAAPYWVESVELIASAN